MVMGLVSGLSLANHSDSGSFLVVLACSANMDSSEEDSGKLVGHMDWHLLSPFDLSQILTVGGIVSSVFLTKTSCCKITHARVGGFSQCFP